MLVMASTLVTQPSPQLHQCIFLGDTPGGWFSTCFLMEKDRLHWTASPRYRKLIMLESGLIEAGYGRRCSHAFGEATRTCSGLTFLSAISSSSHRAQRDSLWAR